MYVCTLQWPYSTCWRSPPALQLVLLLVVPAGREARAKKRRQRRNWEASSACSFSVLLFQAWKHLWSFLWSIFFTSVSLVSVQPGHAAVTSGDSGPAQRREREKTINTFRRIVEIFPGVHGRCWGGHHSADTAEMLVPGFAAIKWMYVAQTHIYC